MQVCFLGLRVFSSLCQPDHFVNILRRRDFPLASFAFFGLGDAKDDHIPVSYTHLVSPQYAVITSDEDDPEDPETVRALEAAGAQVLFTREGTVTLVSDGEGVRAAQ